MPGMIHFRHIFYYLMTAIENLCSLKPEEFIVMWYLNLNEFTWNLSAIIFCVFSVAAVFGVVCVLKKGNILDAPKRWQQVLLRLALVEAIVATILLAIPKAPTAPAFDTFCAYFVAVMCTALGAFIAYVASIYATMLMKWIFAKSE